MAPPPTIVNALPFSTKEPAVYQADLVISFPAEAGADNEASAMEQKYFVARSGETRRTDYELSDKETLTVLEKSEGKVFILLSQKKCSTEAASISGGASQSPGGSLRESLTTGWLAEKIPANFTALGKEQMGGKLLDKYRVRFEKRNGVECLSEAVVWVDPEIGMPVRTELYNVRNDQTSDRVITEFRNLKLEVDAGIFDAPAGCQNIPGKEMQQILRQGRLDENEH